MATASWSPKALCFTKAMKNDDAIVDPRVTKVIRKSLGACIFAAAFAVPAAFLILTFLVDVYWYDISEASGDSFNAPQFVTSICVVSMGTLILGVGCLMFAGSWFLRRFAEKKGYSKAYRYVVSTQFRSGKGIHNWCIIRFSGIEKYNKSGLEQSASPPTSP